MFILKSAAGREGDLLLAVAPHVAVDHNTEHFVEELVRFVAREPRTRERYPGTLLRTYQPFFDYEDHLKSLLIQLADKGYRGRRLEVRGATARRPGDAGAVHPANSGASSLIGRGAWSNIPDARFAEEQPTDEVIALPPLAELLGGVKSARL